MPMLPTALAQTLKDLQQRLLNEGKLYTIDQLNGYYATFREKFGPERLMGLDGEALLNYMHRLNRKDRNTLVYWLEFKDDEEFPGIFGSIAGGSALKYGVYPNAKTGAWMSRDASNYPIEITLQEAIEIARRHRDQLLRGVDLLQSLPENAAAPDYQQLQAMMDEVAPDVSRVAWGHKYFSLLFPTKLDDYHSAAYQRFHLVKLLQSDIPEEQYHRYSLAWMFVAIARELDMPINHLTSILNSIHGGPNFYWNLVMPDLSPHEGSAWEMQRDGGFVAMRWPELGNILSLNAYVTKTEAGNVLREKIQTAGLTISNRERQGILDFVVEIKEGDVVVLFEPRGRRVVAIGRVQGDYYHDASSPLAHRRPVEWLAVQSWPFPVEEGFDTSGKEIKLYANQVEIERQLFEAQLLPSETPRPTVTPVVSHAPVRLTGLPGRIQAVLERKGQVILYGPPGTGKTYWAESAASELAARSVYGLSFDDLDPEQKSHVIGGSDSLVQICSFHPAYGYEDFLEGYRPQAQNDQMKFVRQDGIFKRLCMLASQNPTRHYTLIIDEINRGDIPRIFGELLTILEKDKRGKSILLPLSGELFSVPSNIYVIGTMNTADRSIALLDTALRRRFGFIELMPDMTSLGTAALEGIPLGIWLEELNKRILAHVGRDARNLQIGHAYFLDKGQAITDFAHFARVIHEDIIPLLEEYCYEDYSALKNILGTTLVNESQQSIRHDLFSSDHEQELVQALLEPIYDVITLWASTQSDKSLNDDASPDDEDEA